MSKKLLYGNNKWLIKIVILQMINKVALKQRGATVKINTWSCVSE